MLNKFLFSGLWRYNKLLFGFVWLFIAIQIFFCFRFARLALLVDNYKPVPKPISFEAFPFVVYNMYSGNVPTSGKYSYMKIVADGEELLHTDLSILQEDQFINPAQKFVVYHKSDFKDETLKLFLTNTFGKKIGEHIYNNVSNERFKQNDKEWSDWLKRYYKRTYGFSPRIIELFESEYYYNEQGKPDFSDEVPLLKFHD